MKLTFIYAFLALISTVVNFAAQDLSYYLYTGPYRLLASLVVGTLIGLMAKYLLDKRYIFNFRSENSVQSRKLFLLYSLMGLITTPVFWLFEFGFHYFYQTKEMRYLGGSMGLAVGYFCKFQLDKRLVFLRSAT